MIGADLHQHRPHRRDLPFGVGGGHVDDVDDQIRLAHHLQRGAEGLDHLVGQLAHEADGVGGQHRLAAGQRPLPGPGIEGGEQPILDRDVGIAQAVQEGRLSGVGVADQRHRPLAGSAPRPALRAAGEVELAQVGFEPGHPPDQPPAVHLELGLARPAGADATGLLAEGRPPAAQARQPVPQQRQLDLGFALGGAGVLGEDVEDHGCPVDGGAPEQLLEVALLRRRELVVEHHGVGVDLEAGGQQLLHLALPDEGGRIGGVPPLDDAGAHVGTSCVHQ